MQSFKAQGLKALARRRAHNAYTRTALRAAEDRAMLFSKRPRRAPPERALRVRGIRKPRVLCHTFL